MFVCAHAPHPYTKELHIQYVLSTKAGHVNSPTLCAKRFDYLVVIAYHSCGILACLPLLPLHNQAFHAMQKEWIHSLELSWKWNMDPWMIMFL